ncbi:response regulator [Marinobacterium aestuariivivens]|uniref:Response regulator n=1 Tax=Marinobacterium aestuariivivens TaxID=1698799 RepID=A0ABW2A3W3_9GAMM
MVEQTEKELPDLSGLSLLVVDDDPGIVRGFIRVLAGLGAEVSGVGSLREARASLDEALPDALLVDLQLKDGNGLALLPDYLGRRPDGAFYMVTGHGSIDNAVAALRQGHGTISRSRSTRSRLHLSWRRTSRAAGTATAWHGRSSRI